MLGDLVLRNSREHVEGGVGETYVTDIPHEYKWFNKPAQQKWRKAFCAEGSQEGCQCVSGRRWVSDGHGGGHHVLSESTWK